MKYHKINIYMLLFLFLCASLFQGCEEEDVDLIGNWVALSDLDGLPRSDAVGFSIIDKGYMGTGYDGEYRLKDFWEYNASLNTWTQKADFPGVARNAAIGFATMYKGYIGTGFDGKNKLNDFWEYDPDVNSWTQKADFPGSARYSAVGMAINDLGYIGTGYDGNYLKDFWEYNPATDTWTQRNSIGGSKRRDAACFVIEGKGYIVTGIDNGSYESDVWEFDPSTGLWTKKRSISGSDDDGFDDDYENIVGVCKVGFSLNGRGYLATGGKTTSAYVWEYNPLTDLWLERTNFEGASRSDAVAFVIDNKAYLTTGKSGTYYFDDLWSFEPESEYNEDDK